MMERWENGGTRGMCAVERGRSRTSDATVVTSVGEGCGWGMGEPVVEGDVQQPGAPASSTSESKQDLGKRLIFWIRHP